MTQALKKVGIGIFYIYVLGLVILAVPYFNWEYATRHGFASWLLFGEVISTAKATIWPCYAIMNLASGHSSSDANTDPHFANSRRASYEALAIISRAGGVVELSSRQAADVTQLLQASVTEAELADDAYLQQVHPEFLRRFREDYTGSLRDLADGIRTGNQAKLITSVATYNSFSEWVGAHKDEVRFP